MASYLLPDLHAGQRRVAASSARFRVVACGRRWGKTSFGAITCLRTALAGGVAWWVAPSYPMAAVGWRMVKQLAVQVPQSDARELDRRVSVPGRGWLQVRSADDPDSLRGEGLDLVVMDEAAFTRETAWTQALRPALADRRGCALFLSTPKGRNWFYHLYLRGQDQNETEYASWNLPSADNPYLAPAELEQAQRDLPQRWFEQEHLARFLEDGGGVFRGVRAAITDRTTSGDVFVGVDLGQSYDATVFVALQDGYVVGMDRFTGVGWALQFGRLQTFCDRFAPARIVIETNFQRMFAEQAQRELPYPVEGFVTTAPSKRALIDALARAIERQEVTYPDLPELVNELEAFEFSETPAGGLKLGAPAGYHDDCVIALALAYRASCRGVAAGSFADFSGYDVPAGRVAFRGL